MIRSNLSGLHVLVVEDEYLMATDLAEALELDGADVVGPAASVRKAQALMDTGAPIDIAVLDVNLAGEYVFAVADRLAAADVPFVFITGYDASLLPPRFGGCFRLEKPVDLRAVIRTVRDLAADCCERSPAASGRPGLH